jgi:endonuclease/exonuclease/phosphatase family metal-dependent hydrolase
VSLRGAVPGQLLACPPCARPRPLESVVIGEELLDGRRETDDVARGHDAAGVETAHRLGDATDVVCDGRDAGAECAQQRAALVQLWQVREDSDGGFAEGAVDLRLRQVAEPPLDLEPVRRGAVRLDRLERIPGYEQTSVSGASHGLDRVAEALVGPDHPEGEHRPAVIVALGLAREHGVGDDAKPLSVHAQLGKRLAAALAVHDDPVEAREEPAPQLGAVRRAARKQVVGREDGGQVRPKEVRVELWRGQPLEVEDVRAEQAKRGEPERMLRDLERQTQRRAAEEARRERIEELAASVSVRLRRGAEAKARRDELDVRPRPRQRRGELVVVRRREGRWIGEQDAHGLVRYVVAMLVRTWNLFHGNASPPERRTFLRRMIELVTRDRPDVVCLQELPVWALRHLERWSGMHASGAVARRPLLPFAARGVTAVHHGLLRSAVTGEADAILTRDPARALGVHVVGERKLRRIAHVVDLDGVTVVNFHIDGDRAQLDGVVALARERSIVAGDANIVGAGADGFSEPLAGSSDHILVRGLALREGPSAWPLEWRMVDGRVLSDHAPVEVVVE